MPMPTNIPIIDTMLGVPEENQKGVYDFMRPLFRDAETIQSFDFPVQYLFKDFPKVDKQEDYITYTLKLMDQYWIERALTGVSLGNPLGNNNLAVKRHPDRFIAACGSDPNRGMEGVREIVRLHEEYGTKAVSAFSARAFRWRRKFSTRSTRSVGSFPNCASCSGTARNLGRRSP